MSKLVKDLVTKDLRSQLAGINDVLLVNVVGLDAIRTTKLRRELRSKNIRLEVVKNSLARRATEGTSIATAFEGMSGTLAIVWGAEDVVSLAKEITRYTELKEFEGFQPRGGAMDGTKLSAPEIKVVSKWPSRQEQLSILLGQILGPGAELSAQLIGMGGSLASQIKQRAEDLEKAAPAAEPAAPDAQATAQ
ncbi:MAG TPA: 50S ribosomal protein L10 [Pirellulales bacterium]|jgi:ribosomal protein L10|nr:50S ribosomal protein L10 [Pirellulales bacterium]